MEMSWIEPQVLAASPLPLSGSDVRWLHKNGIRAILTLTERPLTAQNGITSELLAELTITPFHVPIEDFGMPSVQQVADVLSFIDEMRIADKPILVHCKAGQGRTGTILHAYYLNQGWGLTDSCARVLERRPLCDYRDLSPEQQAFLQEYAANGRTIQL